MRRDVPGHSGAHDGEAPHGRGAGFGEVARRAVLAYLLADASDPQLRDQQGRPEHCHQERHAAGDEQRLHRRLPARPAP